jgi:HYDIN/CFA65/VesB-like, Ig-like domain
MVTELENPQQMEVFVNGPDGVNRLILCSGIVPINQVAESGNRMEVWKWRVGPILSNANLPFRRAIVDGALCRFSQEGSDAGWSIAELDADWNDDLENNTGQVEVTAEIVVDAAGQGRARVQGISYQVSILLAMPASSPAALVLTPPTLDFGILHVGDIVAMTITVFNSGAGSTGILAFNISGPDASAFNFVPDASAIAPLAAGASRPLSIQFLPGALGSITASFNVTSTPGGSATSTLIGVVAL